MIGLHNRIKKRGSILVVTKGEECKITLCRIRQKYVVFDIL